LLIFQPSDFDSIVAVNLTSLLVLTTLFIGIASSLPRTSYVKMIDVWLIVRFLVPFVEVLLHTAIDSIGFADAENEYNIRKRARICPGSEGCR
jgi:hypothetical protein